MSRAEVDRLIRRICYPKLKLTPSSEPPKHRPFLPVTEEPLREVLTELVDEIAELRASQQALPPPQKMHEDKEDHSRVDTTDG